MTDRVLTKLEKEFICFLETIHFFIENCGCFPNILEVLSGYIKIMNLVLNECLDELGMNRKDITHLDILKFNSICEEWYQNFDYELEFFEALKIIGDLNKKGDNSI